MSDDFFDIKEISDDFFNIKENNIMELIETKIEKKNIPRRVSIEYELTIPKEEKNINDEEKDISKEEGKT